jgi:hypothetical protein
VREHASQYHLDSPFSTDDVQASGGLSTTAPQEEQVATTSR